MSADSSMRARKGTLFRRLASNRPAVIAVVVLLVIVVPCAAAPLFAPYNPTAQPDIIALRSQPPSLAHPFGTDPFSRDVLSRVLYGGRVSLSVALIATLVSITLGTAYGAVAGYVGGALESVMMRLLDALLSIPRLLLLIAIFAAWRQLALFPFVVIVGFTGWYGLSRVVRGQVLAMKGQDFVISARALGAGRARILLQHILPNVLTPVIVAAALGVGHVILLEAGLSYLGVGVRQPQPSWGNIIQDGSDQIAHLWWISFFPGMAIVMTVMAFNVLGDALRAALDPRQTPAP
ncbi:MAG TPA: ABC transporter permease [Gemmatimonadaceae bacterium]